MGVFIKGAQDESCKQLFEARRLAFKKRREVQKPICKEEAFPRIKINRRTKMSGKLEDNDANLEDKRAAASPS